VGEYLIPLKFKNNAWLLKRNKGGSEGAVRLRLREERSEGGKKRISRRSN